MAGSKNVLIIEDDPLIKDLYRMALANADYVVETAESAEEAYSKLTTFHPDFIFLDVMLPGTSGLEILKELRSNEEHGCIKTSIVILTNLAQRSVADFAMENGADGFIIKADMLPKDLPNVIVSLQEG
jgi:DNA-binding response OmpR family regulator